MLKRISTKAPKAYNKEATKKDTEKLLRELAELQAVLYAEAKHPILIVLQGIDAAGKDGAVKKVFCGVNPTGCTVHAFKAPTEFESSRGYLWRANQNLPAKGMIQIFNRSYYEDLLVPTVHNLVEKDVVKKRYDHINNFERMLQDEGTVILKFYLHISKEEQKVRFKERATSLEKKYKYDSNDLAESKLWDKYMDVYEKIFDKSEIDWHIVPSDDKWYRNYVIAHTLVKTLKGLKMKYPATLK